MHVINNFPRSASLRVTSFVTRCLGEITGQADRWADVGNYIYVYDSAKWLIKE